MRGATRLEFCEAPAAWGPWSLFHAQDLSAGLVQPFDTEHVHRPRWKASVAFHRWLTWHKVVRPLYAAGDAGDQQLKRPEVADVQRTRKR